MSVHIIDILIFKRFGSKSVVKYAYIGISTDRQCHNLFWQLYKNKYRICPIRILYTNIRIFYHRFGTKAFEGRHIRISII
jgi:hypothetical protein